MSYKSKIIFIEMVLLQNIADSNIFPPSQVIFVQIKEGPVWDIFLLAFGIDLSDASVTVVLVTDLSIVLQGHLCPL